MAVPIDTPLTGDIWRLSFDDLLSPLPDSARLGGPGPFVISLNASSAPITLPDKGIAGCHTAHVYQVQRMEDRRPRYRLRLGPFANEDHADAVLKKVRDIYPGALTATADAEDLRAIATLQAKVNALQAVPSAMPTAEQKTPVVAVPAAVPTLSARVPVLIPRQAQQLAKPQRSLETVPAASAKPAPSATSVMPAPEQKTPVVRVPTAVPALREPVPVPRQTEQASQHAPSLESTQTVRALTQLELDDDQLSRWFVIQLSLAEDAFDPDTVPNLDIFSVYRLYSVAGIDQGRIVHALRLGFFTEEIAAGAVASYLAEFYDKPTIKRVSSAERERFAEQSLEPRKDVGATGKHAAIEITSERFVRERRSGQTAAK
jgi:hypothetical protein